MGKEYRAKSFKSGNSVAIRMPAALGIEPDGEWSVEHRDNQLVLTPRKVEPMRLDVDAFWGMAAPMVHVPAPKEDFEPRPSDLLL
ncbi:AbrB/MazE/SpoVT family DNA-binding domain-containing protein [Blastomonas sp.]|uniref:AbrB/MazE/SpoVT family DNA-binding domain-containing protein n=1 Tax=Blastomonas sp. TaxID=1909299 RepID=UPI002639186C|nr:AbrB/MazE/SpoVT family DNA-binding domain-containing protein [Blastomonas sp.]MDM7956955.1 AbrB/MazE/SpoVT family DNA-binding domain-containing protein [Blastomonas sp.]